MDPFPGRGGRAAGGLGSKLLWWAILGGSVGACISRWVCAIVGACLYASDVFVLAQVSALPRASVCVWMSV